MSKQSDILQSIPVPVTGERDWTYKVQGSNSSAARHYCRCQLWRHMVDVFRHTIGEQSDSRQCHRYQPWMLVAKCVQDTPWANS